MEFPLYFWIYFIAFVMVITVVDLKLFHKKAHNISLRESSTMVGIWVLLASIFCTFIYFYAGRVRALEFITGYTVELALSVDNVFVFLLIFMYFKIPRQYQHRVLYWGILGAIIMRLLMIMGGIYIFKHFAWIFYIFGTLLVVSAIKILFVDINDNFFKDNSNNIMRFLKRFGRVTDTIHGNKFIVQKNGRKLFTPLFIALILVEKADLLFALDSIPAILAITQSSYIVFTSNIFAILGLRSLYFMVEGMVNRFRYLKYGISLILGFIGIKMMASTSGYHIPIELSLLFIIAVLSLSVVLSWYLTRKD